LLTERETKDNLDEVQNMFVGKLGVLSTLYQDTHILSFSHCYNIAVLAIEKSVIDAVYAALADGVRAR
jgi:hypothetical protein